MLQRIHIYITLSTVIIFDIILKFTLLAISCPSLSEPSNGIIKCSVKNDRGFSYEDTCNFTCETGYELIGSESRTCQINGNWSGSIAMCTRSE